MSMESGRLILGVVALLLAGCGGADSRGPDPVPRSIDPATGLVGQATSVQIVGDNFLARPNGGQIDTRHRVWLDDLELDAVAWIDAHTLGATVPAGITPGSKTLTVENAFGGRGSLPDAFTAVDLPAALAATVSVEGGTGMVLVGQAYALLLEVSNPGGAPADVTALAISPVEAGCGAPSPAAPLRVAGGRAVTFTIPCAAAASGSLAPMASVEGLDARSGGPLAASATLLSALAVQPPAVLTTAVGATPVALRVGDETRVTFYVANGFASGAATLTDLTPWVAGAGDALCSTPALPTNGVLSPGEAWSVGWTCIATEAGELFLGGTLAYTAGGAHLGASPAVPLAVTVAPR